MKRNSNLTPQGPRFQTSYQPARRRGRRSLEPEEEAEELKPKRSWRKRIKRTLLALLIVLIILAGWLVRQFLVSSTQMFGGNAASNLLGLVLPSHLHGEDRGRVNILITGDSEGDPGHPGAQLTDSIMILSVDPHTKTAFLVSVPRDLWVSIPGYGSMKINAVYPLGRQIGWTAPGYRPGGIGLLQKTLEDKLGLPIDYYVFLNYQAVRASVNALGGVDIDLKSPDPRGVYDPNIQKADHGPLKLKNGPQHLDGQTALNLMRARNNPAPTGEVGYGFPRGDFNRSAYQQQIFGALEHKVFSWGVLLNPLRLASLMDAVGPNVHTSLKINDARRLTLLLRHAGLDHLKTVSLGGADGHLLTSYTGPYGEAALIPRAGLNNYNQIRLYLKQVSSSP